MGDFISTNYVKTAVVGMRVVSIRLINAGETTLNILWTGTVSCNWVKQQGWRTSKDF
jgi:hypothetical protein